jgi:hypothetical protein
VTAAFDTSAWDPDALPPLQDEADLVLLANESMRARRRPVAILTLWAMQALLALVVAWPASATVSAWYGSHPDGDAPLWNPGAYALMDLVLHASGAGAGLLTLAWLVLLVAAFADLLPTAMLIASIAYVTRDRRAPTFSASLSRATEAFPTFASMFALATLVEGFIAGAAMTVTIALSHSLVPKLGEARGHQIALLTGVVLLGGVAIVGVLHDLARTAAVRFRVRWIRAWRCAWNALARNPLLVLWAWAWRSAAGWAPVAIAALVAAKLGGRGGTPLIALALVHQLAALARVALRASWLATALRAVDRAHRVIRPARG